MGAVEESKEFVRFQGYKEAKAFNQPPDKSTRNGPFVQVDSRPEGMRWYLGVESYVLYDTTVCNNVEAITGLARFFVIEFPFQCCDRHPWQATHPSVLM